MWCHYAVQSFGSKFNEFKLFDNKRRHFKSSLYLMLSRRNRPSSPPQSRGWRPCSSSVRFPATQHLAPPEQGNFPDIIFLCLKISAKLHHLWFTDIQKKHENQSSLQKSHYRYCKNYINEKVKIIQQGVLNFSVPETKTIFLISSPAPVMPYFITFIT